MRHRAGRGEPLLLVHGLWESWHRWTPVLGGLSAARDVLAPTLRGHLDGPPFPAGEAPTVEAWADGLCAELDAAGWPVCDIVGNSLGGWLGSRSWISSISKAWRKDRETPARRAFATLPPVEVGGDR